MKAFETTAVRDDERHLTLREPMPETSGQEFRVIVLFDPPAGKPQTWPPDFLEKIHIADPTFVRPDQGELPPAPTLSE